MNYVDREMQDEWTGLETGLEFAGPENAGLENTLQDWKIQDKNGNIE